MLVANAFTSHSVSGVQTSNQRTGTIKQQRGTDVVLLYGKKYHKKSKDFLKISDKDWKGRTFSAVAAVIVSANSIPEDRRRRRHQLLSTNNNNETAQELVKHTNKGSRTQE